MYFLYYIVYHCRGGSEQTFTPRNSGLYFRFPDMIAKVNVLGIAGWEKIKI